MVLIQIKLICLLIVTPKLISCELWTSSIINTSPIDKIAIQVLKSCFQDDLKTLIITKDLDKNIKDFATELPSAVIIIDNMFGSGNLKNWNPSKATFVVSVFSIEQFESTMSTIHSSPWWNSEAIFMLLEHSEDSCDKASDVLYKTWQRKILSVVYLCYHGEEHEIMLYTFNPFTNRAPEPWEWSGRRDGQNPRWNLYQRAYLKGLGICANLIFDKTDHLDGYELKIVDYNISHDKKTIQDYKRLNKKESLNRLEYLPMPSSEILSTIHRNLNLSPVITIDNADELSHWCVSSKIKFTNNDYDLSLCTNSYFHTVKNPSYPFCISDVIIVTKLRPFLRTEQKIINFFRPSAIISLILTYLTTALVLRIKKVQELSDLFLEIIRMLVYCAIRTPLDRIPMRIYFFGIFWLLIIINGTFQGHLASFLTKPERFYVETPKDLVDLRYQIFLYKKLLKVFSKELTTLYHFNKNDLHGIENIDCSQTLIDDIAFRNACINTGMYEYKNVEKYNFYISTPIAETYVLYPLGVDSPLKNRINQQLVRYAETGLTNFWYSQGYPRVKEKLSQREAVDTAAQFRPIKLKDLMFAFQLLIIGHSIAFVVFIMEVRRN